MISNDIKAAELFKEYLELVSIECDCDGSFVFYGGGSNYDDYSDCYPSARGSKD